MKKNILIILSILILLGVFYLIVIKKDKNKVFVTKELSKKKEINNYRGEIVYKNDESNKGYNMVLKVPEKWSHLDYSRLGQPKDVALPKNKWQSGDKLYNRSDSRYYEDGKPYLSIRVEKIVLRLINDRESISVIERVLDNPPEDLLGLYKKDYKDNFSNSFKDINNIIYIDEKTGRKKIKFSANLKEEKSGFSDHIFKANQFVCSYDAICSDPNAEIDPYQGDNDSKKPRDMLNYSKLEVEHLMESRGYTLEEYMNIRDFFGYGSGVLYAEYMNKNMAKDMVEGGYKNKDEFCKYQKAHSFCINQN